MNIPALSVVPRVFAYAVERAIAGTAHGTTGLDVTSAGIGLQINVASGTGVANSTAFTYAGGSVTPTNGASDPRYDLVVWESAAVVPSIVAGTPAAAPVPGTLPAGAVLLGLAYIPASATTYATGGFVADYVIRLAAPKISGTEAAPSPAVVGDTDTGLWGETGDVLSIVGGGKRIARFTGSTTSVNYVRLSSVVASAYPQIRAAGADVNVGLNFSTQGSAPITFYASDFARIIAQFLDATSAVNYVQFTPAATLGGITIGAAGSDANIGLSLSPKGTGAVAIGSATAGTSSATSISLKSAVNTVSVLIGEGAVGALGANGIGGAARFNGSGVAWGDIAFFPNDANTLGHFRFSTTGSALVSTGGNARLGVGSLVVGAQLANYHVMTGAATANQISLAAAGSDAAVGLTISGKGTAGVYLAGNFTDYLYATGGSGNASLTGVGATAAVALLLNSKGAGTVWLQTGSGVRTVAGFVDVTSSVNYFTFTPAAAAGSPKIEVTGSDATIHMLLNTKSAVGIVALQSAGVTNMQVQGVASAVNYLQITAAATGGVVTLAHGGTDATGYLAINAKGGTGYVDVQSAGQPITRFQGVASAVNYLTVQNRATAAPPFIAAAGSDADIGIEVYTKSTSFFRVYASALAFVVQGVASAVNYVTATNAATGVGPSLAATGTDASIYLILRAKAANDSVYLLAASATVVQATGVASAVNYITVTAAATAVGPVIAAAGTDTNIVLRLNGKGTSGASSSVYLAMNFTDYIYVSGGTGTAGFQSAGGSAAIAVTIFSKGGSAVTIGTTTNWLDIGTAASTTTLSAASGSADISLNLIPKGTGTLQYNGTVVQRGATAVKTADETVSNSTVLQNDDHLSFAVGASQRWHFRLIARVSDVTIGDASGFKFAFTVPAAATIYGAYHTMGATEPAARSTDFTVASSLWAGSSTFDVVLSIDAFVTVGANAGTVQFQWAQVAAFVETTRVYAGGAIVATRLS